MTILKFVCSTEVEIDDDVADDEDFDEYEIAEALGSRDAEQALTDVLQDWYSLDAEVRSNTIWDGFGQYAMMIVRLTELKKLRSDLRKAKAQIKKLTGKAAKL